MPQPMMDVVNWYLSNIVFLGIGFATVFFIWKGSRQQSPKDVGTAKTAAAPPHPATSNATLGGDVEAVHVETGPVDSTKPKARSVYIDNVKTLLMFWVVVHHSFCAFGAIPQAWNVRVAEWRPSVFRTLGCLVVMLDESYFMGLFFLISAYFTPGSYDKKGCSEFLQDKFWRLGVPLVFCTAGFYPLLDIFCHVVISQEDANTWKYPFWTDSGVLWFTFWLLIANTTYAAVRVCSDHFGRQKRAPTMATTDGVSANIATLPPLGARAAAACVAAWIVLSILSTGFALSGINMLQIKPFFNIPQYVAYFIFGLLARRRRWLERLAQPGAAAKWAARGSAVLSGGMLLGLFLYAYMRNPTWSLPPWDLPATLSRQFQPVAFWLGAENADWGRWVISPGLLYVLFGLSFTFVLLELTPKWLEVSNRFTRFMGSAAYTVYIIHPWIVTGFMWCYALMIGWNPSDGGNLPPGRENEGWLWLGFVFVVLASNLVLWPLAGILRSLPGLRTVL